MTLNDLADLFETVFSELTSFCQKFSFVLINSSKIHVLFQCDPYYMAHIWGIIWGIMVLEASLDAAWRLYGRKIVIFLQEHLTLESIFG